MQSLIDGKLPYSKAPLCSAPLTPFFFPTERTLQHDTWLLCPAKDLWKIFRLVSWGELQPCFSCPDLIEGLEAPKEFPAIIERINDCASWPGLPSTNNIFSFLRAQCSSFRLLMPFSTLNYYHVSTAFWNYKYFVTVTSPKQLMSSETQSSY